MPDKNSTSILNIDRLKGPPAPDRFLYKGRTYEMPRTEAAAYRGPPGMLALIHKAKNDGSHWADYALAELACILGINYIFKLETGANMGHRYEIEIAP